VHALVVPTVFDRFLCSFLKYRAVCSCLKEFRLKFLTVFVFLDLALLKARI